MNLWPEQQKLIAEIEAKIAAGARRILVVLPTGGGKTVVAGELIRRRTAERKRTVFIAHRDELLTQARNKLARFEIVAGIIKSGRDNDQRPQALVQICGIQTLHARAIRRKTMDLPPAEIVLIDEAHHVRARTYEEIVAQYPDAIVIGLTATPCRGDGRGLGNHFDLIVEGPQTEELIELKRSVPAKIFTHGDNDPAKGVETASTGDYVISQLEQRMNTDVLVGDVVTHWLKHAERRKTVLFSVDVAHSIHLCREFQKAGVKAEHLDGSTDQAERDQILARLANGETEVVCNCMVLTEGFDLPAIGCTVLVRPTKSLLLYKQMVGRGLRAEIDKTNCILLDHAGAVHRHGLPTDVIEWHLETDTKAANKAHHKSLGKVELKILARLEIELMDHAGKNNGGVICTYDDFEKYGIRYPSIAPGLRNLSKVRLLDITQRGRRDARRNPHHYRLTYLPTHDEAGNKIPATDEWRKYRAPAKKRRPKPGYENVPRTGYENVPVQSPLTGNENVSAFYNLPIYSIGSEAGEGVKDEPEPAEPERPQFGVGHNRGPRMDEPEDDLSIPEFLRRNGKAA
jgi:DNA repair protein RadD